MKEPVRIDRNASDYRVAVPVYWGDEIARWCIGIVWAMKSEIEEMERNEGKMRLDEELRKTTTADWPDFFYLGHLTQGVGLAPVWNWTNCEPTVVHEGVAVSMWKRKPEPTILGTGSNIFCRVSDVDAGGDRDAQK